MTDALAEQSYLQQFEQRKQEHIEHALNHKNQAIGLSGLDNILLEHNAFPEINFEEINLTHTSLNHIISAPFLVSSMTAGHNEAININLVLAKACEQKNWFMGVGSQRRQLSDTDAVTEWKHIRKQAPNVKLLGNIGLSQLIHTPINAIQDLADSVNAIAMIIHTNPLQECIQQEGTPQFKGGLLAIENLCHKLNIPVIIKETGCGFSSQNLQRLKNIEVAAVDISGLGGTHWGRIEGMRADLESITANAANTFKNWGISTVSSLAQAIEIDPDYEVWASGGVRTGLDAAKLIAMGANMIGVAQPMLQAAFNGVDAVIKIMNQFEFELKVALFCTGSQTIQALQENQLWQVIK